MQDLFLVSFKFWRVIITISYDQEFGQIQDFPIVYTLSIKILMLNKCKFHVDGTQMENKNL
jgi:hypothetical protein